MKFEYILTTHCYTTLYGDSRLWYMHDFDVTTYLLTSWLILTPLNTLWSRDILVDVIMHFYDSMMYFLTAWCTFWSYDILFVVMTYFFISRCTFHTYWRGWLVGVMMYFLTFCLTSWRNFWCYDTLFDVNSMPMARSLMTCGICGISTSDKSWHFGLAFIVPSIMSVCAMVTFC